MLVATACELGAAPLDHPLGLADRQVGTSKPALYAVRHLIGAAADYRLASLAVGDGLLDPSDHVALRRDHIQEREPGVVDGARGFDEFFSPGYWLIIHDAEAEEPGVGGNGGGNIEVGVVDGPPKRATQIGQFGGEPVVSLALSRAIPQSHDAGLALCEVAGMGIPNLGGLPTGDELVLGELADRLQH